MAYKKTNWVDGITPLNAAHMNKIEEGIANASQEADQSSTNISQLQTQVEGLVNDTTEIKADIAELTTSDESKLPKQNVDVLQDISINVQGDQAFLTKTTVNLNNDTLTPEQGSSAQIIPDATSTQSGLMTSSDVIAIQNMQEQIQQLQTKATRLLYTEKTDPTADDINTFVVSQGYTSPFVGIAVVVSGTNHIWYYYEGDVGWRDDGVDVVSNFTNTVAGIIKGSTSDGQVYANSDGTGSVNGWDTVKQNITNIQEQLAGFDASNLVDLTSEQTITGVKYFDVQYLKLGPKDSSSFDIGAGCLYISNCYVNSPYMGIHISDSKPRYNTTSRRNTVLIGTYESSVTAEGAIAIGSRVSCSAKRSIAIGGQDFVNTASTSATATQAIQLGQGTNNNAKTFQVWDYQLLDGNTGKIPTERLDLSSITPTMETLTINNAVVNDTAQTIEYDGSSAQTVSMPYISYISNNEITGHVFNNMATTSDGKTKFEMLFNRADFDYAQFTSSTKTQAIVSIKPDTFALQSTTVAGKPLSSNVTLGQLTLTQGGETLGVYTGEQDVTIDIPGGSGLATTSEDTSGNSTLLSNADGNFSFVKTDTNGIKQGLWSSISGTITGTDGSLGLGIISDTSTQTIIFNDSQGMQFYNMNAFSEVPQGTGLLLHKTDGLQLHAIGTFITMTTDQDVNITATSVKVNNSEVLTEASFTSDPQTQINQINSTIGDISTILSSIVTVEEEV